MAVKTYENLSIVEAARQAGFDMLLKAVEKADLLDILETAESNQPDTGCHEDHQTETITAACCSCIRDLPGCGRHTGGSQENQ